MYFTSLLVTVSPAISLSFSLFAFSAHAFTGRGCLLRSGCRQRSRFSSFPGIRSVPLRGFAPGSRRYNNSTQSRAIDTRYSSPPSRSRSPLSVRFTSPFLLAFTGLSAAATRDDIYHLSLIKSSRAGKSRRTFRPPTLQSRILFALRRGDQEPLRFPPTGKHLFFSLSCH